MTGVFLFKVLMVLVAAFLVADLFGWLTGETLSQWVVKEKARSLASRLIILALIFAATAFLVIHFELLR